MSYTAQKLIRDLIEKEDGEDVVVLIGEDRYLVTGVGPARDEGSLVLTLSKIVARGWSSAEIEGHLRTKHGFAGTFARDLPEGRRERVEEHENDHAGDDPENEVYTLGHIHLDPDDMAKIKEV
jgi:hypothetical protein